MLIAVTRRKNEMHSLTGMTPDVMVARVRTRVTGSNDTSPPKSTQGLLRRVWAHLTRRT